MTTATVLGIVSILIAFALFGASFYMATKGRKKESIIYGAVADLIFVVTVGPCLRRRWLP